MRTYLFYKLAYIRDSDLCPGWLTTVIDYIRYEWCWVDGDHEYL